MSVYTVRPVPWNSPEADAIRRIRLAVFVDEQHVPADEEYDAIDEVALHAAVYDPAGRAVATGRFFEDTPGVGRIGRMAVLREARGTGAGRLLMELFMAEARRRGYTRVVLGAQCHAIPFYQRFGFTAEGPEYMDADIPHRFMVAELAG